LRSLKRGSTAKVSSCKIKKKKQGAKFLEGKRLVGGGSGDFENRIEKKKKGIIRKKAKRD